jgi:putative ABC transport system substrate-binding protein
MRKTVISFALAPLFSAFCLPVWAQRPTKIRRIGYLGSTSVSARTQAFHQGLREIGYVEGKNIVIEWRRHEEKVDRLPALATELVRLKVDVIVVTGVGDLCSAKEATATIPIVMDSDPVGSGFVASLAEDPQMLAGFQMFQGHGTRTNNSSVLIIFTGLPP